jgi:hypothetical protein
MHDTDWLAQRFEEHRARLTVGRLSHAWLDEVTAIELIADPERLRELDVRVAPL